MPQHPNILWFFTDEQRVDSIGAYGSPWAVSPHVDALAQRGTLFRSVYTPSPVCAAARAALLTGLCNSRIGVLNNHHMLAPRQARFLTDAFVQAGYAVASFGKHHYNCPQKQAFPHELHRILDDRVDYSEYKAAVNLEEMGAVQYPGGAFPWLLAGRFPGAIEETAEMLNVGDAVEWLDTVDAETPWLLRVSINAPHTPTVATEPFNSMIDPAEIDLPVDGPAALPNAPSPVAEFFLPQAGAHRLTREMILRTRQAYYGRCAMVDEVFARLLRAVDHRLDDTIIVFCSDHATHLADHGFYQKQSYYEESVTVPLIIAGPGVARHHVVNTPVSLGSLLPTLMEMAGLAAQPSDYASLAHALKAGAEASAEPIVSEIDYGLWGWRAGDRYVMIRDGDWKMALFHDPQHPDRLSSDDGLMLHNLAQDPGERRNLAGDRSHQPRRDELLAKLLAWDKQKVA